jgi:ATP-dependent DNA helicase RecG
LLQYFPFRHIDRTQITPINKITPDTEYVQVLGDGTGELELVWFQGINWIEKILNIGARFRVFGKAGFFMNSPQITHPEMESVLDENNETRSFLEPIYPGTEKLKARSMGGRQMAKFTYALLQLLSEKDIPEFWRNFD